MVFGIKSGRKIFHIEEHLLIFKLKICCRMNLLQGVFRNERYFIGTFLKYTTHMTIKIISSRMKLLSKVAMMHNNLYSSYKTKNVCTGGWMECRGLSQQYSQEFAWLDYNENASLKSRSWWTKTFSMIEQFVFSDENNSSMTWAMYEPDRIQERSQEIHSFMGI